MKIFGAEILTEEEKKKRNEEILDLGRGPLREMSVEAPKKSGRFGDFKPFKEPDKAASMHTQNKREEESFNKREFSYNVEEDPLYQQYIKTARRNGKNAMTDTIARSAAQTGGIAGSYAVAAGANAYNDYIEKANDVIPELEQLAYQRYQDNLEKDRENHRIEEEKRLADAKKNTALMKYQEDGFSALSDEDITLINKSDDLKIEDGKLYGAEGEIPTENKGFGKAYDNYNTYGWKNISDSDKKTLKSEGYNYNAEKDMIYKGDEYYRWSGSTLAEDIASKYRAGEKLSVSEIRMLEDAGYAYDKGTLYKDGEKVEKDYMPYDEFGEAYDKYEESGWNALSDKEKDALRDNGYEYDESTGMIGNGIEYFSWGKGTPVENVIEEYIDGKDVSYAEKLLNENGYVYLDGTLYDSEGRAVMKDYDEIWNEAMKVFQSEGYEALSELQRAVIDYYGHYDENLDWVYRGNKGR